MASPSRTPASVTIYRCRLSTFGEGVSGHCRRMRSRDSGKWRRRTPGSSVCSPSGIWSWMLSGNSWKKSSWGRRKAESGAISDRQGPFGPQTVFHPADQPKLPGIPCPQGQFRSGTETQGTGGQKPLPLLPHAARVVTSGRLAGESEKGPAIVPTPRTVPAAAPKEEAPGCRVMHALPCGVPEPCVVVRLRFGFMRQRPQIAVFHGDRGIHPGMPCGGGQHRFQPPPGDQGDGRLDQVVRGTQVPADGQRIGIHRQDPGPLVEG